MGQILLTGEFNVTLLTGSATDKPIGTVSSVLYTHYRPYTRCGPLPITMNVFSDSPDGDNVAYTRTNFSGAHESTHQSSTREPNTG